MLKLGDKGKISGEIWVYKHNADGTKTLVRNTKNVILNVGKDFLAAWLKESQASGFMNHIAVGSDGTAAQASDTGVITPIGVRVLGTLDNPGASNILENTATFGPGVATGAWQEAALYSEITGGTSFARQTFGVLTKGALDTFSLVWQITLG